MILLLILSILIVAVILAYVTDRPILTPIPVAVYDFFRRVGTGSVWLTLWRALLVFVLMTVAFAMVAYGGLIAGFIAAIIVSFLISDTVKAIVSDLWNFNFVRVDP